MKSRLIKRDLRKKARELGISPRLLLAAVFDEYCILPITKQLEIVGEHLLKLSHENVFTVEVDLGSEQRSCFKE